jgi:aminoglycoside phosphotransferase
VLSQGNPNPVLVTKVPRLLDAGASLEREAASLKFVQELYPGGAGSIPRVIAFEEFRGRPILLETALVGHPMDPTLVRGRFDRCCMMASEWLSKLRLASEGTIERDEWYVREVEGTLDYLTEVFPWGANDEKCLKRTRELVEPLRAMQMPFVLEHGDFSHPNVMLLNDGQLGVVDWEMADPRGTPGHDLFFFLAYAAFAKAHARENGQHVPAVDAAFFGTSAWSQDFILAYANQLHLPHEALAPLFLLCWVRYMAGLLRRLNPADNRLGGDTANWLRQNRYYAIWRHTLENFDRLNWSGGSK